MYIRHKSISVQLSILWHY